MSSKSTSWGEVAEWYAALVEGDDSYQAKVILPNLLRLAGPQGGQTVADIACGSGFFARALAAAGARVWAADISPELIALAEQTPTPEVTYRVAEASKLEFIKTGTVDLAIIVLALQNIAEGRETIAEVKRILKPGGRLLLVLNHPSFRIPKASSWGWDESAQVQYRRVDRYLSEATLPIEMHPGRAPGQTTTSFHRPLQWYFKLLTNQGLVITRLEEWISHRQSEAGPRQAAEDLARKEFPLFLCLEARVV